MKLFLYYASHSFVNQLKKLFKTWVLVFIVCCALIGGLIGIFAAKMEEKAEENNPDPTPIEEIEEGPSFFETVGIEPTEMVELVSGGLILGLMILFAFNADKNGSRIFLPADVALLFPSPMKPQSVLLFRVTAQMGAILAASVYLIFQLPNMTINFGLSLWASIAILLTWILTIAAASLLQIFLYILSASHPGFKPWLRRIIYAVLLLAACGYAFTVFSTGETWLRGAVRFFNAPVTRFIPVWGWLKGISMYAIEDNLVGVLLCIAAILITAVLSVLLIWRMKADFYEDAMARSEETAALLEKAASEKNNSLVVSSKKKKDRADTLLRDGMKHGHGANVFFFKSMYNRFRFAHLHFFTKTMETYLVAALGTAAVCRFAAQTDSLVPLALILSGLCFFRSMGNPLEADTQTDFFLMIPESTSAKLFWSLMGGTVNCLLDVLPAMLAGALLLGGNLLLALAWIPFIVSVDLYATCVGAFIGFSVPVSAGKTVKQFVQIMFIYFGLLPDAVIIVIGLVFGHTLISVLIAAAVNVCLGLLFFFLSTLFLDPVPAPALRQADASAALKNTAVSFDGKAARRCFSLLGLGCCVILVLASALQIVLSAVLADRLPDLAADQWIFWLMTFAPIYLVGVPVGYLILRKVPAQKPVSVPLSAGRFFVIFVICVFMMYSGNILGVAVNSLIRLLTGYEPVNAVAGIALDGGLLPKLLFMVILAPWIEEFFFRKLLIDRMRGYGERLAVLTSAVMFGLFHGNLSQLFYAFALGLVFGYVYLKTGKLRYSAGLHMLVNFLGSIAAPWLLSRMNDDVLDGLDSADPAALLGALASPGFITFAVYLAVMAALFLAGLVLLCVRARTVSFAPAENELPAGTRFRTVYLNMGMLLLIAACTVLIVLSFA